MRFLNFCNRVIEYGFYALFLLTPLALSKDTSELFELNKMWLVWGLTIIISASWLIKMILQKRILFQRTPLDIPIGLFLLSQIISTIFSLDPHTSLWGYYSRFNGGLLSIISYILLYYAFLSNSPTIIKVQRLIITSLISGLIVALWGLPSHFGYDPTCLLFRGTLDVSCWTADFLPKVRIFSTLGQPDWLAAYLAILIPITIAFAIKNSKSEAPNPKQSQNSNSQNIKTFLNFGFWILLLTSTLFYVDLLWTRARSGFLGIWLALISFTAIYYWLNGKPKISFSREKLKSPFVILIIGLLVITFIIGAPISRLNKFSLKGIGDVFQKPAVTETQKKAEAQKDTQSPETNITESGDIRLLVWEGALNVWKANPIFGTGVETFAYAYYKYKPVGQNLTSEWNFLYNKAHNEYLNYLATTGIAGLGTYLAMIGIFLTIVILNLFQDLKKKEMLKPVQHDTDKLLSLALLASYISILVTNFFGFSVVITNVYLFMIPAFVFVLTDMIKPKLSAESDNSSAKINTSIWQWTPILFILVACCLLLATLFRYWQADVTFALGYNLDRAGEYQQGYSSLHKAVELRGNEPVFKDELSVNDAIVAAELVAQKPRAAGIASGDARQDPAASNQTISIASSLAQEAINISNEVVSQHPNVVVFWKTRVRLFHTLSQVDSRYLPRALDAIEKASLLAPNDALIWYNLGVLYGQNDNLTKGIEALEKTIKLKPNYREAYYALGLFYHTASLDKSSTGSVLDKAGKVVTDENLNRKAIAQMQFILDHISSTDAEALKSIAEWTK